MTPDTGQHFNHLIVTILSLHSFQTERTFDQLSPVVQQPLTTDNDLAIIATVKLRYGNIERVPALPRGWEATTQPGSCVLRLATVVLRNC